MNIWKKFLILDHTASSHGGFFYVAACCLVDTDWKLLPPSSCSKIESYVHGVKYQMILTTEDCYLGLASTNWNRSYVMLRYLITPYRAQYWVLRVYHSLFCYQQNTLTAIQSYLNHLHHRSPTVFVCGPHWLWQGTYYPWGTIGTMPRAYNIFRHTKEWKGEKIKTNKWTTKI
jgi:hypothetical protein